MNADPRDYSRRYICAACGFKGRCSSARRGPAIRCAQCATWTPARTLTETLAINAATHGRKLNA